MLYVIQVVAEELLSGNREIAGHRHERKNIDCR